jgi:polar amino acid transport system substrate-binding protein
MSSLVRRSLAAAAVATLSLGATGACSSSSSGGDQTVKPASGPSKDPAAAALLPAAVASKGSIVVAEDASYAPDEFLDADGKTVIGMDADLAKAIGAVLGLNVSVQNITFDSIIPGLKNGRYDLGMSSFTDNKEREAEVNFVTYLTAGTSFFVKTDGGPTINTLADLCGHRVALEAGTTQEADAKAQDKKCTSGGVQVDAFPTQSAANLALGNDRDDVGMADSPIAEYQVKQSDGTFKITGQPYGAAPYGIAVARGAMDKAVLAAVKDLIADGTYTTILDKWGLAAGAITHPTINGAIS